MSIGAIKAAARGRWTSILPSFGIPAEHLDGKHHPCPCIGCPAQKDGFRMTDIAEGEWYCAGKGKPHHGDAFDLIDEAAGIPIGEAMKQVGRIVKVAWSGNADPIRYGSRREQLMWAIIDDAVTPKGGDDGWAE